MSTQEVVKDTELLSVRRAASGIVLLVSVGAWMAWHPAGFLVAGALLAAVVILHQRGREG